MNRYVCESNGQMDLEQTHKHEPTILPAIDNNVSTIYLNLKYTVDPKKYIGTYCTHVIALHGKCQLILLSNALVRKTHIAYTNHYKVI